ncbi:MAG: hypothetical protein CMM46_15720 [Rhodospirillaceae bacterium]|nr:hypothetical protein [Rhodospirillaceae bacterium]
MFGDPGDLRADCLDKVAQMNVGPVEVAFAQQTFVPRDNPVGMTLYGIDQEFQHARGASPHRQGDSRIDLFERAAGQGELFEIFIRCAVPVEDRPVLAQDIARQNSLPIWITSQSAGSLPSVSKPWTRGRTKAVGLSM